MDWSECGLCFHPGHGMGMPHGPGMALESWLHLGLGVFADTRTVVVVASEQFRVCAVAECHKPTL